MTGFQDLDNVVGGLYQWDLVVVGGQPSVGKSTLAMNLIINVANRGFGVAWFDLGTPINLHALALLARESHVPVDRLRLALYSEREEQRIFEGIGLLAELPLYSGAPEDCTIEGIRDSVLKLSQSHPVRLVVVDYLQLITGLRQETEQPPAAQDQIIRGLKTMARELNLSVLVLTQLTESGIRSRLLRPQISALPLGAGIAGHADLVILLHRDDLIYSEQEWSEMYPRRPYPLGMLDLIIAKNRHGPTGEVHLRLDSRFLHIANLARAPAVDIDGASATTPTLT